MAHRSSNRQRNAWAVSLLDVQPTDRVLEVGFGPGIAIRELSRCAPEGCVYGVDHSEVMMRHAGRRNAEGVRDGRVDLRLGSVEDLPKFDAPFDKLLSVNSIGFWDDPVQRLAELRRLLRAGGRIAIAVQPRGPGATDETSTRRGREIAGALVKAEFSDVHVETLRLRPPVVCAVATNPTAKPGPRDG
jgi:ubiquinone/menaquinone biosynthesis C-methylase UbiE